MNGLIDRPGSEFSGSPGIQHAPIGSTLARLARLWITIRYPIYSIHDPRGTM
ncbi:MAG: hypothetical protein IPJ97_02310 [Proteobacteria bacterium]|nr:hypothetical protein [Pseudomonadota bacterium]